MASIGVLRNIEVSTDPPLMAVVSPDAFHQTIFVTGLEALDALTDVQLFKLHQVQQRLQE